MLAMLVGMEYSFVFIQALSDYEMRHSFRSGVKTSETLKLVVVDSKYNSRTALLISEESDSVYVPYRPKYFFVNISVNLVEYGLAMQD